jgi:hypothetical protein
MAERRPDAGPEDVAMAAAAWALLIPAAVTKPGGHRFLLERVRRTVYGHMARQMLDYLLAAHDRLGD